MLRSTVGIDEAGRGPLAGPVSVGVVVFPPRFDWRLIKGVRDSKKLSELQREAWYQRLRILERERGVQFAVSLSCARVIDSRGISKAVFSCISRALARLELDPATSRILLDGSLRAPDHFLYQKTIIGGDDIEPAIALASIAAKVQRDRFMKRFAKKFPGYGFEIHKGYGTKVHRDAIVELGLSDIHRVSFCKNIFV